MKHDWSLFVYGFIIAVIVMWLISPTEIRVTSVPERYKVIQRHD